MTHHLRKPFLVLLGFLLIFLYYFNNTYIINFFDNDFPFLIKRYYNIAILKIDNPKESFTGLQYNPRIISLVLFVIVITTAHALFVLIWTEQKKANRLYIVHIIVICSLVLIGYLLYYLNPSIQKFYYLARVLKDYVQSPISLVLFLILWKINYTQKNST